MLLNLNGAFSATSSVGGMYKSERQCERAAEGMGLGPLNPVYVHTKCIQIK